MSRFPARFSTSKYELQNNAKSVKKYNIPWVQKYAPHETSEVAMHPSKVNEIYKAMTSPNRIVVISGPSGSSKSTIVSLIAKSLNKTIVDFKSPENSLNDGTSISGSFQEFLVGASFCDPKESLVVIDDLPNIQYEPTRQLFEDSLVEYSQAEHQPQIVICFTEMETSSNYSEAIVVPRIIGKLINLSPPHCIWIKTNGINMTIMTKTLTSIAEKERISSPVCKRVIRQLALSGDIRNAILMLEFFSRDHRGNSTGSIESIEARGSPTNLFHAIGKIVYGTKEPDSLLPSILNFEDSMRSFNLTLLENYTSSKHQRLPIQETAEVADLLSISDTNSLLSVSNNLEIAGILNSDEIDSNLQKRFKPLQFTSSHKYFQEEVSYKSKMWTYYKREREWRLLTLGSVATEFLPFSSFKPKPKEIDILADDSDSDF